MAAGSIVVDLLMRTGSFITDTDRAARRLAKFEGQVIEAGQRIAGGAVAITAAIGATVAAVDRIASSIAQYQDIADIIGDSAANVSTLQLAADQSGTAIDSVASASVKLTAALSGVDDESSTAARALAAINIPLKEFQALSPVEQLNRVALELAKFEDGAAKTAVAVQLFGRSGAQLIPFLNDLADAQGRAVGLSAEQIAAADVLSKSIATLRSEFSLAGRAAAADLIGPIQAVVDYFRQGANEGSAFASVAGGVRVAFQALAVFAADVSFVFSAIGREIGAIAAQGAALARGDLSGFRAISDAVKADGERARRELDEFQRRVLAVQRPALISDNDQSSAEARRLGLSRPALVAPPATPSAPKPAGAGAERQSEADRYLAGLQSQLQRLQDLSVAEQVLADIQAGRLGRVTAAQQAELEGVARQIDAGRRLAEQVKFEDDARKAVFEDRKRQGEELTARARRFFEETRTPQERLNAALAEQDELLLKLGDSYLDTYNRAVAAIRKAGDEADSNGKTLANIGRDLGLTFSSALEDAIVEGRKFRELLNAIAQDIARIIVRRTITEPLTGAIDSFFGGSMAGGGDVIEGRGYFVGEQGPEWFQPRTAGTIVPNAGGGGNVTIHNYGADVQTRRESNGDMAVIVRAAADAAYGRVVGDLAAGSGRASAALRSRGVNLDGALARRT